MPDLSNTPMTPTAPVPLLIDAKRAAGALSLSARKLWEITNSGLIPCVRIGRAVRYDPADLRAWIDVQKRKGRRP